MIGTAYTGAANDTVDLAELIDELWDEHPPASATANAQMCAANLRRLLAADPPVARLIKRGQSYELGLEPAEELRQLHRAILNRAGLPPPAQPAAPKGAAKGADPDGPETPGATPPTVVPRQLPTDVAGFTGRETYLRQLDGLRSDACVDASPAIVPRRPTGRAGSPSTAHPATPCSARSRWRSRSPP